MRNFLGLLFFLSVVCTASAQHKISLENVRVDLRDRNYQVIDVQDWRSSKSHIGVVYKSIRNNPKIATIDGNLSEEIFNMIQGLIHKNKVVIGLKKLNIREVIDATSEFGYAEVVIRVALKSEDHYYDLGIFRYTSKYEGIDVTNKHGKHIGIAFQGALDQIKLEKKSSKPISLEELKRQEVEVRWTNLPVIDLSKINTGLYLSFASLKKNSPDDTMSFEVRGSKNPTLYLANKKGKFRDLTQTPYFLAVNKQGVYVNFNNYYYKTRVSNGKWVFIGPRRSDLTAIDNGANAAGLVGAVIVGAATKDQFVYQINTLDGSVKAVKKIR